MRRWLPVAPQAARPWWRVRLPTWPELGLGLALALALATRLAALDLVEFRFDEALVLEGAADLQVALRDGRPLPQIGIPSSLGLPNPPFFVYLMALPLLVSPAPELATGFVGLLNVGALLLTAWLARSLAGPAAAALAALTYATAPWAVIYSRQVWGQDAMPFFLLVGVALLALALRRERPGLLLPSLVAFALASQLHMSALALTPLWLLALLAPGRRGRRLLWLALGGLAAVVLYLPYLLWQADHGWPLLTRPSPGLGGAPRLDALFVAREAVVGLAYPDKVELGSPALLGAWPLARRLLQAALALGVLRLAWLAARAPARRWPALLVLAGLALPVLAFARPTVPLHPHYFIPVLPFAYLAVGAGLAPVAAATSPRWLTRLTGLGAAAVVLGVALLGAILFADYVRSLADGRATLGHGPPLASRRQALALLETARSGPAERLYAAGDDGDGLVYRYLLRGLGVPVVDDRRLLALPGQGSALYLLANRDAAIAWTLRTDFEPTTLAELRPTTAPPAVELVRVPAGALARALAHPDSQPVERAFAAGLTLLATRVEVSPAGAGPSLRLTHFWRVSRSAAGPAPQSFNHLVDATGRIVAQADGPLFRPAEWPPDDVLVTPFVVAAPGGLPAGARLRTGLYYLETLARVPLADGAEWVELPLPAR